MTDTPHDPDARPALYAHHPGAIPHPTVRRLSLYLRQLETFSRQQRRTVSSKQLAQSLDLTDAQVRKDLAYFGQFGRPGVGYRVPDLIGRLKSILGTDKTWNVALIGAGNLGSALLAYRGFERKGFHLAAVFDIDPGKVGKTLGGLSVQLMDALPTVVTEQEIRLAILAVPTEQAQSVAERLIAAGVRGILNFAPTALNLPHDIALNSVDLAVQLEQLSFQVNFASLEKMEHGTADERR